MAIRTPISAAAPERPRPILEPAFRLQDQPARAEKAVAEDQGDASEQRKHCKAVERAASEVATFRLKALNECAEHHALREGAEDGAVVEGVIPEGPMLGVAVAELERDATENERQQHDGDREINRRYDDRKSERESGHKRKSAEHQPGFVAVPDRRDRVHDQVARISIGRESVEYAHAQIEAVQEHIQKDANAEHERPDGHEIENGLAHDRRPVSVAGSA